MDGLSKYPYLPIERILDSSKVFTELIDTTDGMQAINLICGFERAAFDTKPEEDDKYQAFTTSTEQDETAKILSGLLNEITVVMKRQLEDHLPGGIYHSPDEHLQVQAQSCTSNNIIAGKRILQRWTLHTQRAKSASLQRCMNK